MGDRLEQGLGTNQCWGQSHKTAGIPFLFTISLAKKWSQRFSMAPHTGSILTEGIFPLFCWPGAGWVYSLSLFFFFFSVYDPALSKPLYFCLSVSVQSQLRMSGMTQALLTRTGGKSSFPDSAAALNCSRGERIPKELRLRNRDLWLCVLKTQISVKCY